MNSADFAGFLNALPLPAILIGADQRVVAVNPTARALLSDATTGRHFALALRQPDIVRAIEGALTGEATEVSRVALGDGLYQASAAPLPTERGQGVLVSFLDVSEAERIGQQRRDFVANVSHELRTPLTALIGFIETLQGAARDDAAARSRFLGVMAAEAARMNRLVSDLLSLSRVEARERQRPTTRVDLFALCRSAATALDDLARSKSVVIECSAAVDPAMAAVDPDEMTQVMNNLIGNAIAYGAAGKRVVVRIDDIGHDAALRVPAYRISVTDFGDGIAAEHLPRLTERFYRVDTHRSRAQGGTGLGLAIVKHIVARHRGRLQISSEPGKGSTFAVILPGGAA